jgi:hypothetical protein
MRSKNRLFTLILSVFFLGFIGVFASQVVRFTFGNSNGLPDPVYSKATIVEREKENKTSTQTIEGTKTPRTTTVYHLIGEYQDGSITRRGTYTVSEDVYYSHEEGSTLDIYYYPGMTLSGYGLPIPSLTRRSSFDNMSRVIGVFMLGVAGLMAFIFIRSMLIPMWMGKRSRPFAQRTPSHNSRRAKEPYDPFSPGDPRR